MCNVHATDGRAVNDEAQALPAAVVTWDPPRVPPQAERYAAGLLERIENALASYRFSRRYEALVASYATKIRPMFPTEHGRTTHEQDLAVQKMLDDFAQAVLAGAKRDLHTKVSVDLATTLVPLLADKEGTS